MILVELMMERISADGHLLSIISLSVEATFELNGNVNRHNFSWSEDIIGWLTHIVYNILKK